MIMMIRVVGGCIPHYAPRVIYQERRIHTGLEGTPGQNFALHDGYIGKQVCTVLHNGGIGELGHRDTRAVAETGATGIECVASRVDVLTKAFVAVVATGHVGLASIDRYVSCLVNEFVGSTGRSSVTTARHLGATIQQKLHRQVEFFATFQVAPFDEHGLTDLDAISQC